MAHRSGYLVGAAKPLGAQTARKNTRRRGRSAARSHALALQLDAEHPTPLYHQITQALRWKIGTGALPPGAPLPPLREAERIWGVNYHTVRQAYAELRRQGYITSRRKLGTCVTGAAPVSARHEGIDADVRRFVQTVRDEARERYGLDARQLAELVLPKDEPLTRSSRVVVVECNAHQCSDIAAQLEAWCQIEAVPWDLQSKRPLPDLPIIGTYFHHNEMRRRWPDRIGDMRFVSLHLDRAAARQIAERAATLNAKRVIICERNQATGRELACDLKPLIPAELKVSVTTRHPAEVIRQTRGDTLVGVAPRVWDTLRAATRAHDRIVELRHVVEADLARLAPPPAGRIRSASDAAIRLDAGAGPRRVAPTRIGL